MASSTLRPHQVLAEMRDYLTTNTPAMELDRAIQAALDRVGEGETIVIDSFVPDLPNPLAYKQARQQAKTRTFARMYGSSNTKQQGIAGKIKGRRPTFSIMDDPMADAQPLILTLISPRAGAAQGQNLAIASDLRRFDQEQLKSATYLISDLRTDNKSHQQQTASLIGAIERATDRKLPLYREIQISGADDREEELHIDFVATADQHQRRVNIPTLMVANMTQLYDHQPLIIIVPARLDELPVGLRIFIAFTSGDNSGWRDYRVKEELKDRATEKHRSYALLPERDDYKDETDDVALPEEFGEELDPAKLVAAPAADEEVERD